MCLGVDKVKLAADEAVAVSLTLAKEGKSLREIEDQVGYSYEWIRGILADHDIKLIHHARAKKPKLCQYCGKLVEKGQIKRCRACSEQYKRNQYSFMTEDQRKHHNEQTAQWNKAHRGKTLVEPPPLIR